MEWRKPRATVTAGNRNRGQQKPRATETVAETAGNRILVVARAEREEGAEFMGQGQMSGEVGERLYQ